MLLVSIEKKYKDVISYNGRPYLDKMKWDRIEMLHALTEERIQKYFKINSLTDIKDKKVFLIPLI